MGSLTQKTNYEFNSEWMKYYEWVLPVEQNKYKAYCSLCNQILHVGSNGHFSLLQHEKSKRHRNKWIENDEEYYHDAINYVSPQSRKVPLEYPNITAGINLDRCRVKIERIDFDDDSSVEELSPSNPQSPSFVRNADKSPNILVRSTDFPSMYQTNRPNCYLTANEGSSSLQSPSKRLDSVENTRQFDDGSRSDLPEINGSSENNSKLTDSDTKKISTPESLDIKTSRATDPSPNRGQSVSPAHIDDNAADAFVPPKSSQIKSDPSIFSPSVAVEQVLRNVEMTFEVDSNSLSVPSPQTAKEQTHQNAEMIFEIDRNCLTTPSTSTAIKETHQNVEMTLEKGNDCPSTSGLSTSMPTEQNTEFPFEKSGSSLPTPGNFIDPNRKYLSESDRYSEPQFIDSREMMFDEKGLPKRSYLQIRKLPVRSSNTSQRVHSIIRDKSYLKNEIHSIFERLDEAKRVYENKCRIIMDDYKILLNKLSQESDPTFPHSDILTPEYVSYWNSLKLLKILLSEEDSSEENKHKTTYGQHNNGSNSNHNFSRNQTREFSYGHGFPSNRQLHKRGRKRKHEVSRQIFMNENSQYNGY